MPCTECTSEQRCDSAGLCQIYAHAAIAASQPKQCIPGSVCVRYARGLGGCVAGFCNPPALPVGVLETRSTCTDCGAVEPQNHKLECPKSEPSKSDWSEMAAAYGVQPPIPGEDWPTKAVLSKWALEAIEAGANAAILMNLEGIKDHLRRAAHGVQATATPPTGVQQ